MEIKLCLWEIATLNVIFQITYQKEKKAKQDIPTLITYLHYQKNSTENNNNDPIVGQNRPITNNNGGYNALTKVP